MLTYSTAVSPAAVGEGPDDFARAVARVLEDPRGWKKYGYTFTPVRGPGARPDLSFRLETPERAAALCGLRGLSCWCPGTKEIIIHSGNWAGKSASRLPLDEYRAYLVNHEVGHALGLDHQRCPAAECRRRGMRRCPASVMQQMTLGPGNVAPCVEASWPLDSDWRIDDPRRVPRRFARAKVVAAVTIVLLLVISYVAVRALRGRLLRPAPSRARGSDRTRAAAPPPAR